MRQGFAVYVKPHVHGGYCKFKYRTKTLSGWWLLVGVSVADELNSKRRKGYKKNEVFFLLLGFLTWSPPAGGRQAIFFTTKYSVNFHKGKYLVNFTCFPQSASKLGAAKEKTPW
jgi:hypothetical protein